MFYLFCCSLSFLSFYVDTIDAMIILRTIPASKTTRLQVLHHQLHGTISAIRYLLIPLPWTLSLKFVSLNAHSLNSPFKHNAMWQEAKSLKGDVICIQETHFSSSNPPKCRHKLLPHIFTANAAVKKQGTLMAIKKLYRLYSPLLNIRSKWEIPYPGVRHQQCHLHDC